MSQVGVGLGEVTCPPIPIQKSSLRPGPRLERPPVVIAGPGGFGCCHFKDGETEAQVLHFPLNVLGSLEGHLSSLCSSQTGTERAVNRDEVKWDCPPWEAFSDTLVVSFKSLQIGVSCPGSGQLGSHRNHEACLPLFLTLGLG